jgi:hypothetical protein
MMKTINLCGLSVLFILRFQCLNNMSPLDMMTDQRRNGKEFEG